MKATVNSRELLAAIATVKPAIACTSLPITKTVMISASRDKITVTSINLEQAIATEIRAEVIRYGGVCTSVKPLVDTLKAYGDNISLQLVRNMLVVSDGMFKTTLDGYKAEDMPPVPNSFSSEPPIMVQGLPQALDNVSMCMANDQHRVLLNGAYLCNGEVLNGAYLCNGEVAAADGFRLAIHKVDTGELPGIIIPAAAVSMIIRLFRKSELVAIKLASTIRDGMPNLALFKADNVRLVSNLVLGRYPDYTTLIPSAEGAQEIAVEVDGLRQALKIVTAIKPTAGIVRLVSKDGKLVLSARDDDRCSEASVDARGSEASVDARGSIKIAFELKYLGGMLDKLHGEVILYTKTPSTPMWLHQGDFTFVVMPMFVQWD